MKRWIMMVAVSAMVLSMLSGVSLTASAFTTEDGFVYIVTEGEVTITDYIGAAAKLTIPDTIDGCPVRKIGSSAFAGCDTLTAVQMGDVRVIGNFAFERCGALRSIAFPATLTSIGDGVLNRTAYYDTADHWENGMLYVGHCLVAVDKTLSGAATIREGTTTIAYGVLAGLDGLTSVTVPEGVTAVPNGMFANCTALTSVTLPSTVTAIGDAAFHSCTSLETVNLPEGLTSIGETAFFRCKALKGIAIPDGVTEIGMQTFYECKALDHLTLSPHTTALRYGAFTGCTSLTEVAVPESVTVIEERVFMDCASLGKITGGEKVVQLGKQVLMGTAYQEHEANWTDNMLYFGDHLVEVNTTASGVFTVPEGTKAIGGYAFWSSDVTEVVLPDSLVSINDEVFSECRDLTAVYYGGTQEQWDALYIDTVNYELEAATVYFLGDAVTGDLGWDGTVDTADSLTLYAAMSGARSLSIAERAAADINGDGAVNMLDALLLYKVASGT